MSASPHFRLVFDVSQKPYDWWFPACGLIFVMTSVALVFIGNRYNWSRRTKFGAYFAIAFGGLWSLGTFATTFSAYHTVQTHYKRGEFSVIEGRVTDFHPMPYEGHQDECFSVQQETFCYSDYGVGPGFNNSASHGGPIREGLPVRVSYIGGTIVRLEIRADAMPSAELRAATAENAKSEWQRRTERDPVLDRMTLGFAIAALFMTAWWNVQPKRFMRFWLKPPYKPLTTILFRVFFAANVIGAAWYVVDAARHRHRALSEYRNVAEIAAVWIAVIFVMVTVVEWMNRRRMRTGNQ